MADDETPSIGVLMFVAYRAIEQEVYDTLRAEGYTATLAQGRIAARITEHGNRVTELADSAQVTKQTASVLVDQLEALGYVERVPGPHRRTRPPRAVRAARTRGPGRRSAGGSASARALDRAPRRARHRPARATADQAPGDHRPVRTRSGLRKPARTLSDPRFRVRGRVKKPAMKGNLT